jgi:DNA polymerase III epsilon subunit-like protein
MKMFMVLDVETTGLLKSKPYLVSIAYNVYSLSNSSGIVNLILESYDVVKPPHADFVYTEESVAVHGITSHHAHTYGIPIQQVIAKLHHVFDTYKIDTLIAHNILFDIGVLSLQLNRYDTSDVKLTKKIFYIKSFCTMEESTNLLKIKKKHHSSRSYFKFPKLIELYQFLFPTETFEQHNAKYDVQACARCYFKLVHRIDIYDDQILSTKS